AFGLARPNRPVRASPADSLYRPAKAQEATRPRRHAAAEWCDRQRAFWQNEARSKTSTISALAWISHTKLAHRGAESAKVVVLQRLLAIQGERPDADRV